MNRIALFYHRYLKEHPKTDAEKEMSNVLTGLIIEMIGAMFFSYPLAF